VSSSYFDVFGIQPYLGRFVHVSDEHGLIALRMRAHLRLLALHFREGHGVVGRAVQLNKRPPLRSSVSRRLGFLRPVLFLGQNSLCPSSARKQVEGHNGLNDRGSQSLPMTSGHLTPGITPAQAISDLNSIGSYPEKTYPKTDRAMRFVLARPSFFGDAAAPRNRGLPNRIDAPGRLDCAGRMRQPRQPVCFPRH
jgi:hypothetical protein